MTKGEVQGLVVNAARELSIPPALALALVEQESGFNPSAYRAEPGYYDRNIGKNPSRWNTSPIFGDRTLWGSYGLTQVLASTAYGEGYPITVDPRKGGEGWPSLYDPNFSARLGLRYWTKLFLKHSTFRDALAAYNAGTPKSSQGQKYADQVLARAAKYLRAAVV